MSSMIDQSVTDYNRSGSLVSCLNPNLNRKSKVNLNQGFVNFQDHYGLTLTLRKTFRCTHPPLANTQTHTSFLHTASQPSAEA